MPGNQVANIATAVPQFWNGELMTWGVMARVDGKAYSLFGVPTAVDGAEPGNLVSAEYTSTHTTFVVSAGSVNFALDYFSPVSPHDYVRQSMPYSYLTVSAVSNDGGTPQVQVYSDADKSWIGQYGDVGLGWNFTSDTAGTQLFEMLPQGVKAYAQQDHNEMAQWGSAVYCTRENASKLSYVFDDVNTARSSFVKSGTLSGSQTGGDDNVIAYSHDLGTLQGTENVTFVIGNVRDPAINYLGNPQSGYYRSNCKDVYCDCVRMLDDFHAADAESRTFDATIQAKGMTVGSNYSDILALSVRQAFGSMDLTIPTQSMSTADSMAFVKEISSDGNVNTVDVTMPMAPIFYVLSPDYIRLSLQPVMDYLASGAWPHNYTVHDIGSNYPGAIGHDDGEAEFMPVEECGNLLALVYMYELATGDTSWKLKYLPLLQEYADFLVHNGLYPTDQRSTDDGAGPRANQTGLTVKAAIALNAFGVMTGQQNYSDVGLHFAHELYNQGIGTDPAKTHFTLFSGQQQEEDTWALHFNLYLDVLLKLNTFPSEALAMQTNFYPSVRQTGGVPLDSTLGWSKTDWMIFGASTAMAPGVNDQGVRDMFVDDVHATLTDGVNSVPFTDNFWVKSVNGSTIGAANFGYQARPVVGGHFALLALQGANQFPTSQ